MYDSIITLENEKYKLAVYKDSLFNIGDISYFKEYDIYFIYHKSLGNFDNDNFEYYGYYEDYIENTRTNRDYYKRFINIHADGIISEVTDIEDSIGYFAVKNVGKARGLYRGLINKIISQINCIQGENVYRYELFSKEIFNGIVYESKYPVLADSGFCHEDIEELLIEINVSFGNKFDSDMIEKSVDKIRSI